MTFYRQIEVFFIVFVYLYWNSISILGVSVHEIRISLEIMASNWMTSVLCVDKLQQRGKQWPNKI